MPAGFVVWLAPSTRAGKKYMVRIGRAAVHFGAHGMSDYTVHKDALRKKRYIARHRAHENWTRAGFRTPGFWSRWLLWNEPSLARSIADVLRRFRLVVRRVSPAEMARLRAPLQRKRT